MSPLRTIEAELRRLGYAPAAIIRDYSFADVLSAGGETRRVELAAFTQAPESYRSAAFGVVAQEDERTLLERRALGAPILLSIGKHDVGVWRVGAQGAPRLLERVNVDAIADLFRRNAEQWRPQAVHRAKSLGQAQAAYQLSFVDLDLLPAIEHEVEEKLDRLLRRVIEELMSGLGTDQEEVVFRTTFRLLAAKILLDREHSAAGGWRQASVAKVLSEIESYYDLGRLTSERLTRAPSRSVAMAWRTLLEAINFRNISSDTLAFVYENTLVTKDTRERFGTHSTPRQIAEYMVSRLNLGKFNVEDLTIFEPFTGAGTFLVAALRHLRDLMPEGLGGQKRHAFLVQRIGGAEIDAFACEVATLSLILADYPNANGWKIVSDDLFRPSTLARQIAGAKIVLCNPPWGQFDAEERVKYPEMAAKSFSKPMAVLRTVLDAEPEGIGFVLPQGFLRQQQYHQLRQAVADLYQRVELVSLPDRTFQRAGFEGALLIANDRYAGARREVRLVSTVVSDNDRGEFLATGKVTAERRRIKVVQSGDLWIGELDELWELLKRFPRLGQFADVYRGLKWWKQEEGASSTPKEGYLPGVLAPADSLRQFALKSRLFLNMAPAEAMFRGPLSRPWDRPKILTNTARLSRGPWRMAAAADRSGLVASQGFFGIWPKNEILPIEALEAILNGPLTNAFLTERASNQHFTNAGLKLLPIPKRGGFDGVVEAVRRYRTALEASGEQLLQGANAAEILNRLLVEVDAEVLKAYDLPPRLERRLLEFFRGHERERRVDHPFEGWLPKEYTAYIPLHEYLGPLVNQNRGAWALEAFTPAPEAEADVLRRYVR